MSTGTEPAAQLRALVLQNELAVHHLRTKAIPHHAGMSAACRALAVEVPRMLTQHLDEDLSNGVLAERWRAAQAATREATADELEPPLAALAFLLREHSRAVARHLLLRGKVWAAEIYRLEGQADALDSQNEQLRRLAEPISAANHVDAAADTAAADAATADAAAADAAAADAAAADAGVAPSLPIGAES
jgi:hypothetical protein